MTGWSTNYQQTIVFIIFTIWVINQAKQPNICYFQSLKMWGFDAFLKIIFKIQYFIGIST